jgi:hypothetical protein
MTVEYGLEDFFAKKLAELHDPFLMIRWTKAVSDDLPEIDKYV